MPRTTVPAESELDEIKALIEQRSGISFDSSRERFFSGLGYASQLSPLGLDLAEVKTIDELELEPTFIKLHLEGHELDALMGAESTLRTNHPIVAATAYHNKLGLWRLPLWLMTLSLNYNYYFRLHSWCGTGAVVYCVPREGKVKSRGSARHGRGAP